MSIETPNNEAAFPSPDTYHPNGQIEYGNRGMTLRDYFAAKAMNYCQSYIANPSITEEVAKQIAETSYLMADAMLKAREPKVSSETSPNTTKSGLVTDKEGA